MVVSWPGAPPRCFPCRIGTWDSLRHPGFRAINEGVSYAARTTFTSEMNGDREDSTRLLLMTITLAINIDDDNTSIDIGDAVMGDHYTRC